MDRCDQPRNRSLQRQSAAGWKPECYESCAGSKKVAPAMLGSPATEDYFNLKPISVVVKCSSLKQGASLFSACAGPAGCRESLEQEDARNTPASNSIALHPASYWCLVVLGREYGNTLHLDYSLLMFPLLTPSKVQSVGLTGIG